MDSIVTNDYPTPTPTQQWHRRLEAMSDQDAYAELLARVESVEAKLDKILALVDQVEEAFSKIGDNPMLGRMLGMR